MKPAITVIIPTCNRAVYLRRALAALDSQDVASSEFEVIVVDDGSTDDTGTVLAAPRGYRLRALRQPNRGPGAARNAAIDMAAGELIVFIDDDVVPSPDLLRQHLEAQRETPGVVIGRMVPPAHAVRQPVWAAWESHMLEKQYGDMLAGRWAPTPRQFYTANASVPRADLVRAGLFDPSFRRTEDVELAYRLADLGLGIRFVPQATAVHDTPRSLDGWMTMAAQYGRYDVVMWRDKGRRHIFNNIAFEYRYSRNAALRAAARALIGREAAMALVRVAATVAILGLARLRFRSGAMAACSAVFNLLFWDGACREIGGRAAFWEAIRRELKPVHADAETVAE